MLRPNSRPQDFVVDETRGVAFVADATGADPTRDDPPAPLPAATVHGGLLTATGADGRKHTVRFGLDPVTIGVGGERIYRGPGDGHGPQGGRRRHRAGRDQGAGSSTPSRPSAG